MATITARHNTNYAQMTEHKTVKTKLIVLLENLLLRARIDGPLEAVTNASLAVNSDNGAGHYKDTI
ncbi:MAG: hypothetical protein NTV43_12565 [Methylococcales bacterium]|nr:hypothetical protein [Methylococcales bacterium]